jgi:Ulp1 family protease
MPLIVPPLPKQKNYTDCGLFLLEYVETFLMQPDFLLKNLKQNKPQAKLFTDEVVKDKRDILKRLAVVLAEGTLANREGNKK